MEDLSKPCSTERPISDVSIETAFFADGKTLIWEYPRVTPGGEQMDLVEVTDVKDGRIQHHRVYWGWCSIKVLEDDAYRRG